MVQVRVCVLSLCQTVGFLQCLHLYEKEKKKIPIFAKKKHFKEPLGHWALSMFRDYAVDTRH